MKINDYGFEIDIKKGTLTRDGIEYDMGFLSDCCMAYERMCTARYIRELKPKMSYQNCYNNADEVRNLCDDYGLTESEALEECGIK